MPTMYKVKDQKGLALKQKESQVKIQAMDLVGRIQTLGKKGVKVDMEKMEVLAKISMIVEILKDNNLIAFPELDLYYQEGLNILLSKIEKQVADNSPKSKLVIARNNMDINRLKQKTGVN